MFGVVVLMVAIRFFKTVTPSIYLQWCITDTKISVVLIIDIFNANFHNGFTVTINFVS